MNLKKFSNKGILMILVFILLFSGTILFPKTVSADSSSTTIRIKNVWQGSYLYENGGQVKYGNPASADTTSQWILESYNGNTRIKNVSTGHYMNIENQLAYVQVTTINDSLESAQWTIIDYNGHKKIKNVWQNTKYINIEGLPGYATCTTASDSWQSAQWDFETVTGTSTPTPIPTSTRGAQVPYQEYEAENGTTNATVLASNRNIGDPAGEASGRKAVKLSSTGQYVQWKVTQPANSIVIRYSIPDSQSDFKLSVYKNGTHLQDISVTSRNAWLYGNESNPTNNASNGTPRRVYDESHALLVGSFAAGDTIKIQKDSTDTASYYSIDFIDLENVSQVSQPVNSLSITSYGATANDTTDDATAIQNCINDAKAQGKVVWIPAGQFYQSKKINADNVTIKGAGMWYSELYGYTSYQADVNGDNNIGFNVGSYSEFYDFRVVGEATMRDTGGKAFSGAFGTGSELHNIWVEHTNCGAWVGVPNSTNMGNNLKFDGCRIRNTFADGINLCNGTSNSTISNCNIRNTGDDGLAIWSANNVSKGCTGNTATNNTVQFPWRASGIAVYGGGNNTVNNNLICDTLTYPGITISSGFTSIDFSGTTTISNNGVYRCGGAFWGGQQFGAIWLYACDSNISAPINFTSNDVYDSTYSAVYIQGDNGKTITGPVTFNGLNILNAGTYGIMTTSGASGSATFSNAVMSGITQSPHVVNNSSSFKINQGSGNSGW